MTSSRARLIATRAQEDRYRSLGWPLPGHHKRLSREEEDRLADSLNVARPIVRAGTADEIRNEIDKLSQELPPSEDPVAYLHLTSIANYIRVGAEYGGVTLPSTLLATLPLGAVNAATVPVPASNERVIFVDSGLVIFVEIMSTALARLLPVERNDAGQLLINFGSAQADEAVEQTEIDSRARKAVVEAVLEYAIRPHPVNLTKLALRGLTIFDDRRRVALGFHEIMLSFVLAHEYGHILLKHGRYMDEHSSMTAGEALLHNWRMEGDADVYGFGLAMSAMVHTGGHSVQLACMGGELLFSCLDLVYRAVSTLRYGDENHTFTFTHPDPATRRVNLRETLKEFVGAELAEWTTAFGRVVEGLLDRVWVDVRDDLTVAKENGVKPSAVWAL